MRFMSTYYNPQLVIGKFVVLVVFLLHSNVCSVEIVRSYTLASQISECSGYVYMYINRSYMHVQGIQ